jgi:hypothetical protein
MTTITTGTRVSFQDRRRSHRPYIHTVTGVVTKLVYPHAIVELDSGLMPRLVLLGELTALPAGYGGAGQDDVQDALAVHPSPFQLIAEDYESEMLLAQAGNLGVWEP